LCPTFAQCFPEYFYKIGDSLSVSPGKKSRYPGMRGAGISTDKCTLKSGFISYDKLAE